ncbi:MAG: hypothetical protein KAU10_00735, partial [Dehalococcoidia bacterium]|nr:hypothetical protein [Dehalococcoidia bacterium]
MISSSQVLVQASSLCETEVFTAECAENAERGRRGDAGRGREGDTETRGRGKVKTQGRGESVGSDVVSCVEGGRSVNSER